MEQTIIELTNGIIRDLFYLQEGGPGSGPRKGGRLLSGSESGRLGTLRIGKPEDLVKLRNKLPRDKQWALTQYTAKQIRDDGIKVFTDRTKQYGYGLKGGNEIANLISVKSGMGQVALAHAIRNGGRKLDCFDLKSDKGWSLVEYYKKAGFLEAKREKNWTPGKPDVVYMKL